MPEEETTAPAVEGTPETPSESEPTTFEESFTSAQKDLESTGEETTTESARDGAMGRSLAAIPRRFVVGSIPNVSCLSSHRSLSAQVGAQIRGRAHS